MITVTQEQFDTVENVVGKYCMGCPEDTLNDDTVCENCHIRHMMDVLEV